MFHKTSMINDDDILKHISDASFKNLNQVLRTFDDPVEDAYTFNDSRYISLNSDSNNSINGGEKFGPVLSSNDSRYVAIDNVDSIIPQNVNGTFSIISLNIQSLNAKFDSLVAYLSLLEENNVSFSAICLQETWLTAQQDVSIFHIPGYKLINRARSCSAHGGLIIYLKEDYTYNERQLSDNSEVWEGLFIDIDHEGLENKITLANIYRPPKNNDSNAVLTKFNDEIRTIVNQLSRENSNCIITGDTYINLLKINKRTKFQEYFDIFITNGLFPKITLPTRYNLNRNTSTLIDHLFCKFIDGKNCVSSGILIGNISDHLPYFAYLDLKRKTNKQKRTVLVYKNTEESINKFYSDVSAAISSMPVNNDLFGNPNDSYNSLENVLMEAKAKHFQPREVNYNKYKHKYSPWITSGIIPSIKYRDLLYWKLKKTDALSPEHSDLSNNLRLYNSILKRNIRLTRTDYYAEKFEKYKLDIRRTWSIINEALNKSQKKDYFPNYFIVDGNKTNCKTNIANSFNSFFANIGKKLSDKINCDTRNTINTYLKQNIISSFAFECVEVNDVLKIISDLAPKKSCGIDHISSKLLKRISIIIAAPLAHIVNQSLCTGIFPDRLKIARVIPLYKKDDPHLVDNYRPISILPAISKVFERIVFNQLYDYMYKNELFYVSQYGFRKINSTELASVELVDRIRLDIDKGRIPLSVFLDLSKAFDTLDHSILLKKLNFYGISGIPLQWFSSYFMNREQLVDYDGTFSSVTILNTGVPQGSILGPLLFIIYMNDIHEASENFHAILYADDTSLFSSFGSFNVSVNGNNFDKHVLSTNINNELQKKKKNPRMA